MQQPSSKRSPSTKQPIVPRWLPPSEAELAILKGMKKKIGIIRLWPKQAAAEHESIERYRLACKLLGVELVELDRLGLIIDGPRRPVTKDDVDFVISLHFETPKAFDCFSWGALWNPIDFYVDWGVNTFLDHQFSHDGYFSCSSRPIERMCETELGADYAATPRANVNHSLSGPIYPVSARDDRRLVYCGINWERLSNKPGRFDRLLEPLDKADVLDVFGPELVQNVRVWEGFEGYKYEVPFDGQSLIKEISNSGAVLALSSNAHLRSGVMTSRLFEGAASGALVFADENAFVARYFAEEVVPIKVTGDHGKDAAQIIKKLEYYNNNPDEGFKIASALQKKYIDSYMLHTQILGVYKEYIGHKAEIPVKMSKVKGKIGYLIFWLNKDIPFPVDLLLDIERQTYDGAHVVVIMCKGSHDRENAIFGLPEKDNVEFVYVEDAYDKKNALGMFVCDAVDALPLDVEYVCVSLGYERLFSDFAYKMLEAASGNELGAVCSLMTRHYDPTARHFRREEHVDYWRPRKHQSQTPMAVTNMLIRREVIARNAAALQMIDYNALRRFFYSMWSRMAPVNSPLVSFDLKKFEQDGRVASQPYDEKIADIIARYYPLEGEEHVGEITVAIGSAEPGRIIGEGDFTFPSFLARMIGGRANPLPWVRLSDGLKLRDARAAARRGDWRAAEQLYAHILRNGGNRPNLWKQYGHTLKEQGHLKAASFAYRVAMALDPEDDDTRSHLKAAADKMGSVWA